MRSKKIYDLLSVPTLIWYILFLVIPLIITLFISLCTRTPYGGIEYNLNLNSYLRVFESIYFKIYFQSLKLAFLNTGLCLLFCIPVAWAMSTMTNKKRNLFLFLMSIPFLSNLMIRIYSIKLFFGFDGPIIKILNFLSFQVDPFSLSQNQFLVFYGLFTTYLPFMLFPIYSSFEKFDFSLVEASYDLGASPLKVLFKIIIPNQRKAIINGCLLVFIPSFGEFLIPDLLGGAKNMLIGNLITEQFLKSRDWPFGAALSMVVIFSMFLILYISHLIQKNYGDPSGKTKA